MDTNLNIEVKKLPETHLAAVQSIGVQNLETAYQQLISWAISENLFPKENSKMITVYHDSFKTTPPDQIKMHAGLLLKEPIEENGMVFPEVLPEGKYIIGHFEITHEEFGKAWSGLFQWMNENGFQFRKTPPFEMYHNNFQEHPEKKSMVDFYIPVED